ncbi:MAG: hypothetical protein RL757_2380 [Bacteroidota bacterium]|jgi:hypothetical protein
MTTQLEKEGEKNENQRQSVENAETKVLETLREIVLRDDRLELQKVQQILNDRLLLSEKVNPIVEEHLDFLKQNFPKEFSKIVDKMIEQKIKNSQNEILNVIYPQVGQMITKYVNFQIQLLREQINERIEFLTSKQGLMLRLKAKLFGLSEADLALASVKISTLEEVFLIQKNSGLLLGSASRQPKLNRDVVAGMLTAIKAFIEDAFERENQELEGVNYGNYQIFLQNFPTFYAAIAVSGAPSVGEQQRWREQLIQLVIDTPELRNAMPDDALVSKILYESFIESQQLKK